MAEETAEKAEAATEDDAEENAVKDMAEKNVTVEADIMPEEEEEEPSFIGKSDEDL